MRLQEEEPQHAPSLASAHQRRAGLILEAAEANIAQFEQVRLLITAKPSTENCMSPAIWSLTWETVMVASLTAPPVHAWSLTPARSKGRCSTAWLDRQAF